MKKRLLTLVSALAALVALAVPSFAAEPIDVTATMTNSFESISTQMMNTLAAVLPIALGIIGAILAVTFGIKLFKKLTGKA